MTDRPSIVEFLTDPQLLGLTLSLAQEVLLRAIYGLPIALPEHLELWRLCTGRQVYPERPFGEVTVIAGARSGKDSRIAAPIAVYEAVFGGHEAHLGKGERSVIPLVAQDQRATRVTFGYVREYLATPLLASMVEEVLALEIRLANRTSLPCFPCTLRALRGYSNPCGVMNELGFYRLEGAADSDAEIQSSIRRGTLGFPSPRLVKISTPYMRSGVLYDDFKRAFGQDDPDLLVWRAPTALMNPTLTPERLERERRLDPDRFAREYEAEFAEDLDALLPGVWVDAAVIPGRYELPPREGVQYTAATDPSGAGADAFTFAIVHTEGSGAERRVVQDVMKGWGRSRGATVDLEGVVAQIAEVCGRYGVRTVRGDRYAGQWVRQAFEGRGLRYEESAAKAQAYLDIEPFFAQGRLEVLDHPILLRELKTLERRPQAGGRVIVDHPRGGHDDYANALALAAADVMGGRDPDDLGLSLGDWDGSRSSLMDGSWIPASSERNPNDGVRAAPPDEAARRAAEEDQERRAAAHQARNEALEAAREGRAYVDIESRTAELTARWRAQKRAQALADRPMLARWGQPSEFNE